MASMNDNNEEESDQGMEEKPVKQSSSHSASLNRQQSRNVSSEESEEDDDEQEIFAEGAYNPADYEHLAVSSEVKDVFQYISRYTPQTIELETKLRPFIPDLIPAVGDIDAFIKAPRPDNKTETLGLTILDEPCAKQSDPAVLDLQLRALSKETSTRAVSVKAIDDAERNSREIDSWIKSISDLHRSKPPPAVHYTRNMPDIDTLMQEWDPEFEELLKDVQLPTADMDCTLEQYIDIMCALLDIPVYKSRIESLHVLFTLYLGFKRHQHFQNGQANPGDDDDLGDGFDRLVLQ